MEELSFLCILLCKCYKWNEWCFKMAPLLRACAIYHMLPSSAVQFLAQMESPAGSYSIQSKNVTISSLFFLNSSCSPGWCGWGMKSAGRAVWENFPSVASRLASWFGTSWVVGRKHSFKLWEAYESGFVFPQQGVGKKCSVYPLTLFPSLRNLPDPWPLGVAW